MLGAVREHLIPTDTTRVLSERDALTHMRTTTLGLSSPLHTWDDGAEVFVSVGPVRVENMDTGTSLDLLSRLLETGTTLRRLDIFLEHLVQSQSPSANGPTIHAFAHALNSVLIDIRRRIREAFDGEERLSSVVARMKRGSVYGVVGVLGVLCYRSAALKPATYDPFPCTPQTLLSHLHDSLALHLDRYSPTPFIATLAYILTCSSAPFIQRTCTLIGYSTTTTYLDSDDEEADITACSFLPEDLRDVFPRARRSLHLLRAAGGESGPAGGGAIQWVWTEHEIRELWLGGDDADDDASSYASMVSARSDESTSDTDGNTPETFYPPPLAGLAIFDLLPDGRLPTDAGAGLESDIANFTQSFPPSLPSPTPTLPLLTSLIFAPLVKHAETLSSSLLDLALTKLNLRAHLILLRGYMLMTSHAFRSRLKSALFSDEAGGEQGENTIFGMRDRDAGKRARSRSLSRASRAESRDASGRPGGAGKARERELEQDWPIGLAHALVQHGTWPPYGADLSFSLRSVIVDSIGVERGPGDSTSNEDEVDEGSVYSRHWEKERREMNEVFAEADNRLGFAVRDLEGSGGEEGWKNPFSIESLDFLYMDYHPPPTLDVVITPAVLSKYQRVFGLLLRVMRVESALSATFRILSATGAALFPTLSQSNKQLLHFRFVASQFVGSVSSYLTDVAIGSRFDAFLGTLGPSSSVPHSKGETASTRSHHRSASTNTLPSSTKEQQQQRYTEDRKSVV